MKLIKTQSHAGSFRHAPQRTPKAHFIRFREPLPRATFLSEEGFRQFESFDSKKIENGSMEIRKKLGAKKAEKSYCFSFAVLMEAINILRIVPH